jgi:hypothetical protein
MALTGNVKLCRYMPNRQRFGGSIVLATLGQRHAPAALLRENDSAPIKRICAYMCIYIYAYRPILS